jgi:hypothetical protein
MVLTLPARCTLPTRKSLQRGWCAVQIVPDFLGITVLPERVIDTQTPSSEQSTRKTQEVHCAHCDRDGILALLL